MTRTLTVTALIALTAMAIVVIGLVAFRAAASTAVVEATREHRFSFLEYELSHLPNRWLMQVAEWFDDDSEVEEAILDRWFESQPPSDRNRVERMLERRLTEAIQAAGLTTPLPLFSHQRIVWPPVDIEFGDPLRVLAVSPRDEIRLISTVLLHAELPRDGFSEIEAAVEGSGEHAALVTAVGGVALYPALVVTSRDYQGMLHLIAHEWMHHYLVFYPLGQAYGRSGTLRTINETVPDIVGEELTEIVTERFPRVSSPEGVAAAMERQAIRDATDPILRALRLEVDALLAAGEIETAEALMEETRLKLAAMGRTFRRINQAFFAFRGAYGANPATVTPWGDRLFALRERSDSLAHFLSQVRQIGSDADAERLLNR